MNSSSDPRRPERIVRLKTTDYTGAGASAGDDPTPDYMNVLGMVFSMFGLMMRVKWCGWVALYCACISYANSRVNDDTKQILSSFMLSVCAVVMSYLQNPQPIIPPWALGSSRCCSDGKPQQHHRETTDEDKKFTRLKPILLVSTALGGAYLLKEYFFDNVHAAEKPKGEVQKPREEGDPSPGLPSYTMDQIREHDSSEKRIWMTYRQGVYDVTDFVNRHPGGDNIMLAAGGATDPFWNLYAIHKEPHVLKILAKYRIGNISEEEAKSQVEGMEDAYSNEPKRHPSLKPASKTPFNAEPPMEILADSFITPNDLFYVRNHLPVPDIKEDEYELEFEGEPGSKTITLSLSDLKKLPKTTVTAVLQCAGNRRGELIEIKPVRGLVWNAGAIGNARWTGVRLTDFLKSVGVDPAKVKATQIQFDGYDTDPTGKTYGASVPADKALDPKSEVILAYEMNDEPLSRDHGFPVRVIVPGVVAARSVKWLNRISFSDEESWSFWQRQDYKGFSPSQEAEGADFSKAMSIQEMPVTSAFTYPKNGSKVRVKNGKISAKGYAWSGGGRPIIRVDISADGGKTWYVANMDKREPKCEGTYSFCWSWTLWSAEIPTPKGVHEAELMVKAIDASYNSQPDTTANIWNFRGVLSNAYHRVVVKMFTVGSLLPAELEKFKKLSSDWWNSEDGSLKGLHSMNALRIPLIKSGLKGSMSTARILDVGCGGGILAEPLSRLGAEVTGLDPLEENIAVAETHKGETRFRGNLSYVCATIEDFANTNTNRFDALVSSEVIEHVANPGEFVANCVRVVKPGGSLFFTTISRTSSAYWLAIVAAERLTSAVPPGTHDWNLFVSPGELTKYCEEIGEVDGVSRGHEELTCTCLDFYDIQEDNSSSGFVRRTEGDTTIIEGVIKESRIDSVVKLTDSDPKHSCPVCALESRGIIIRHTDVRILNQFLNSKHEMLPRKLIGICKRQERRIKSLIMMAQNAGLLPSPKLVKMPWEKLNRYYVEETDVRDYKVHSLPHLKHLLPENYGVQKE
ncbi:unnamed protein product [Notodromas monacha]|uniref:Ubiquinone biosynthesis O-methyltransferase, mitochondrial n=1 Tax=Notodromas monacha TaxID=399045 RepID=A0A7R9GDI6_9CRUS|nr:unnamed protein product [Notodromas monacha]CAG0918713.1 unnamed protein product [Notodromas monacha]